MGWNCPACGKLLKPEKAMSDIAKALWKVGSGLFLPKGEPRVCSCEGCGSRFLIFEGEQPRIYLNSVIVCMNDGEGDVHD